MTHLTLTPVIPDSLTQERKRSCKTKVQKETHGQVTGIILKNIWYRKALEKITTGSTRIILLIFVILAS